MKQQPRVQLYLLNGPPYTGKDALANYVIKNDRTFGKLPIAFPIKEAMRSFFGLTAEQFKLFESSRELKDQKHPIFMGKSWRQVNIDFAEKFVKPVYGEQIFGHLLVNRIKQLNLPKQGCNIIVSDTGFTAEIIPLIKEFGAENIHVIKLERNKSSYEDDSRGYVDCEELKVGEYFLRNAKQLAEFQRQGFSLVQALKHGNLPQTTPFEVKSPKNKEKKPKKSTGSKQGKT